jgi:hypothetical protein
LPAQIKYSNKAIENIRQRSFSSPASACLHPVSPIGLAHLNGPSRILHCELQAFDKYLGHALIRVDIHLIAWFRMFRPEVCQLFFSALGLSTSGD